MIEEKYMSPEGYYVDAAGICTYNEDGLVTLAIQSTPNGTYRGQVYRSNQFELTDNTEILDIHKRIYAVVKDSDDIIYIAHSNNLIERLEDGEFKPFLKLNAEITSLYLGQDNTLLVSGLNGYVAQIKNSQLVEMPLKKNSSVHSLCTSPNGTLYAACEKGQLFCRKDDEWISVLKDVDEDMYCVDAVTDQEIYLGGAKGFCAVLKNKQLKVFKAPTDRTYYCTVNFQGNRYFGAGYNGLDVLKKDTIVPFKDRAYAFHISTNDNQMLTTGIRYVSKFDGNGWLQIPFN